MAEREVYIVGAARTPVGSFLGSLAGLPAPRLGAAAIAEAVRRSGLAPEAVDEVFFGNVLTAGVGQAPARQAAIYADLPVRVPATTVGKVCGSGLQAVVLGAKSILLEDAEVVVAGGMESMSNAPYLLPKARSGYRLGHGALQDSMILDGLWDPYGDFHMGNAGETCAREYGFSRDDQDAFARESYLRARAAQESGAFLDEIVPVAVPDRRGERRVDTDEEPTRANLDSMAALRPAFQSDGTITAANASTLNDGGAALVLASSDVVKERGLTPLARIRSYGGHAQAPEWFTTAPVGAVRACLDRAGLEPPAVDLYEINEAFSVVSLACARDLGVSLERTNVHGGAVALGHPIGASGARILVTLLYAMRERDVARGVASLCIGGGEALAILVERDGLSS